jgi:hypothetical protein
MNRETRKAAIAAYKERKPEPGIYVVRCKASGGQWVGSAPDLGPMWNRITFALRQGVASPRSLQAAWKEHGAENLHFETLEILDDDQLVFGRDRMLKERLRHWAEKTGAETI